MTSHPRSLDLAIDIAHAWRSDGMGMQPAPLREGVGLAMSPGRSAEAEVPRLVLESVIAGIVQQLERAARPATAAASHAPGVAGDAGRLRALCAALAAGIPMDVLVGQRRPALRASVHSLLARVARGVAPATGLGHALAAFDSALVGPGQAGAGRERPRDERPPRAMAFLRHAHRGRHR